VKKSAKLSLGSLAVAGALGAMLIPATAASATDAPAAPSFACPADTDTIEVPFAFDADNNAQLAGVVCVVTGTTQFDTMNVTPGWSAQLKSDGSNGRTEVKFAESSTRDKVELRYQSGRTEIKN
jgi:hypothetical protein